MSTLSVGLGRPSQESHSKAARRHPRESSGAYQVFDPQQVQVFREAFNLCDQDGDGVISQRDLEGLLASLGQTITPTKLASLLSTPSGTALNFTTFVTLLASHLSPLDAEPDLLSAFASFDPDESGTVSDEDLRRALASGRDGLEPEEIDALLHPPFFDPKSRKFNYRLFCQTLRVTDPAADNDQQQQQQQQP
ncbi:hypothetical protein BMF94_2828 [Rhodotorula taiwanensis]|uniref:EF-hand domain-containing protein n=1 Tax=Rhodotorula taiwanensis TaxID=741276 RepID=A0A2S5BB76_9BASI|nr:hypothetical protein BMF94_2828 [Rhodotorula taiwanensis]